MHPAIEPLRMLDRTLHMPVAETFLDKQPFVTDEMRRICVGWIMEVQAEFRMRHEIIHRCVALFDRFLDVCNTKIHINRVQLVIITTLIIACKVEQYTIPKLRYVIGVCDRRYTRKDILHCEWLVLRTLDYHVTAPTALHILIEMCAVLLCDMDPEERQTIFRNAAMELDLWLFECSFLRLPPFLCAAGALRFSMKEEWCTDFEEKLQLSREEVESLEWACRTIDGLHNVIRDEPRSPQAIVLPKFGVCSPTR